jgi:phosphate uptake regulator
MFKELLSIFRGVSPLQEISANFQTMLKLSEEMILEASNIFWQNKPSSERIAKLRQTDVRVNQLERAIRKQAATNVTISGTRNAPYNLLMMSLVKDVERLGDYAKNLAEASQLVDSQLPDDALTRELRAIRDSVETFAKEAGKVFQSSNIARAHELTVEGRSTSKRCDELLKKIACSDYGAANAVKLALGARYYKRIEAHLLNLVSSLIMPLHKLDYFDEDFLDESLKGSR